MLGLCNHSNLLFVLSAEERRAFLKLLWGLVYFAAVGSVQNSQNVCMSVCLPTAIAREVMQSPPSVCPSVCFHSIFRTDWLLALIFCVCVDHYHGWQGIETEGLSDLESILDQGQFSSCTFGSKKLHVQTSPSFVCLLPVVVARSTSDDGLLPLDPQAALLFLVDAIS